MSNETLKQKYDELLDIAEALMTFREGTHCHDTARSKLLVILKEEDSHKEEEVD